MGDDKTTCQCPEELKRKPGECSPEQIRKCHGDTGDHPCARGKETDAPEKEEA